MNNDRSAVIENLLNFSRPLDELRRQLSGFEWDFDGVPIVLYPDHIVQVLRRYLSGELNASMVEMWANLIEGREDLTFDGKHEKWLTDTVYELANPVLTTRLEITRARELIVQGERA
jgi:hypothetical protein